MGIVNLRRLLITLAVGTIPTAVSYILGWWWAGTIFLLLTLFAVALTFSTKLYPLAFSFFAVVAISMVLGGVLDGTVDGEGPMSAQWSTPAIGLASFVVGVVSVVAFWLIMLSISTRFLMTLGGGGVVGLSFWEALKYVAGVTFDRIQPFIKVEDGEVAFRATRGKLANLGGPGLLIVSTGNAAVLEWGGKISRIVGPGIHPLRRFEDFWKPVETKGIVDLRPQFAGDTAKNVRTKDGVALDIEVGTFFQLEPKHITDQRPGSQFAGGDATTKVIGGPEFPVYEAIIKKSLFQVPRGGWKAGWFPGDPIHRLRDVVATYTLDEIFSFNKLEETLTPDQRVIKEIEDKVVEMFDPSGGGVWFKGIDIRRIAMPDDVEDRVREKWKARVARALKIADAETERDVLIIESVGRARSLERLEGVKLEARAQMASVMSRMVDDLSRIDKESVALSFVSIVHELTNRVGQDEAVAMRYIEAMHALVESDGAKGIVITPPTAAPGFMPSPPAPALQTGKIIEERLKSSREKGTPES